MDLPVRIESRSDEDWRSADQTGPDERVGFRRSRLRLVKCEGVERYNWMVAPKVGGDEVPEPIPTRGAIFDVFRNSGTAGGMAVNAPPGCNDDQSEGCEADKERRPKTALDGGTSAQWTEILHRIRRPVSG